MKILLCNPKNNQGTLHSRKGMYPPLGILSIATCLKQSLADRIEIDVCDEDVQVLRTDSFQHYDLVGFYSTTFNYGQAVQYAYFAKECGCITVLGGPHPSMLAGNIMHNRTCFDYVIKFEAELPFLRLVQYLLGDGNVDVYEIPNLVHKSTDGTVICNEKSHENRLEELPIPSRDFIPFDLYVENYKKVYPDKGHIRPGSIYSSKGCSWRDKTGGCVFCARLEEGTRFRDINQIWTEIQILQDGYNVNSIWDISDDNLNNREWFERFVKARPESCKDLKFFIYSRVNCIVPDVMDYFKELNVEEVFLGVESGDNRLLRKSFKGQTRNSTMRAIKLLRENNIRNFPSFVLGLPDESEESLKNTYNLCRDIAELGGLDRVSTTLLKPIPGSKTFDMILDKTRFGKDLSRMDDVDLAFLEKYWANQFTDVDYDVMLEYKEKMDSLMSKYSVFGSSVHEE